MNKDNASNEDLVVEYEVDGQNIKLSPKIVQDYIVGTGSQITLPEFKFFTELCKARRLNPFLKEAYLIKYGNSPAQMVVGKDVIVQRAVLHPQYDGKESGVITQDENGEIFERKGCFYPPNEQLVGGWCKVYRKDWGRPEYMSVSLSEVAQKTKDGSFNSNWANKTATMLEKVAKVRALREAFVDEFAGMYDVDEVPQTQYTQPEQYVDVDPITKSSEKIDINEL